MKTLEQFVAELRSDVDKFEADWKKNSKKSPDDYPMSFPDDNDGIWMEQFTTFLSLNDEGIE